MQCRVAVRTTLKTMKRIERIGCDLASLLLLLLLHVDCSVLQTEKSTDKEKFLVAPRWTQIMSQDYEIVVPERIRADGTFLSHHLLPTQSQSRDNDVTTMHFRLETSRDALVATVHRSGSTPAGEFQVHVHRGPSGKEASDRREDRPSKDSTATWLSDITSPECTYYSGFIQNKSSSSVAISLCPPYNEMMGLLTLGDGEELIIEPVPRQLQPQNASSGSNERHHVLYRHEHTDIDDLRQRTSSAPVDAASDQPEPSHHRHRRSVATSGRYVSSTGSQFSQRPHRLDVLVVVDSAMMQHHRHDDITTYTMAIMNMVSHLFSDSSLGFKINISVVALYLMEQDEPSIAVTNHAAESLDRFCAWQSRLDGVPHDHAILLTGVDICSYKDSPCDTLGYAPIKGMCQSHKSCSISEDTGLGTAFTVAHEIGHSFGMYHDGEGNACPQTPGSIMSPTLLGQDGAFRWSSCSRKYITEFLQSPQSTCIVDDTLKRERRHRSSMSYSFPDQLPGQLYDANTQCRWQFPGEQVVVCKFDFAKDLCKSLWCYTGGYKCETKHLPAAEGTKCGVDKWCRKGVCVPVGDSGPLPIDGGWSNYTEWGACTRSCGGGVKYKERFCTHPRSQYGGKDCDGENRVYKMCNAQACPEGVESFRSVQCKAFNGKAFRGQFYEWVPYRGYTEESERCRLYCKSSRHDFYFALASKVVDGTRCHDDRDGESRDVCIEGACQTVGCDGVVESGRRPDQCGVCGGSGSTCRRTSTELTPTAGGSVSATLPTGARDIQFVERYYSPSGYWTLTTRDGRTTALLGSKLTDTYYTLAGTEFVYIRRNSQPTRLTSAGPTNTSATLKVLKLGTGNSIRLTFTEPVAGTSTSSPVVRYDWTTVESTCSVTCGIGYMTVTVRCVQDGQRTVGDTLCDSRTRPEVVARRSCSAQQCPASYRAGEWQTCSRSCGGGTQKRPVRCYRGDQPVPRRHCRQQQQQQLQQPSRHRRCNTQPCARSANAKWVVGEWSKCSVTCDTGIRHRTVACRDVTTNDVIADDVCTNATKPNATTVCRQKAECYADHRWMLTSWSQCSTTCGRGARSRSLICAGLTQNPPRWKTVAEAGCRDVEKTPEAFHLEETCQLAECEDSTRRYRWYTSDWKPCSVTCGSSGGVQHRLVWCLDDKTGHASRLCPPDNRPSDQQSCAHTLRSCPTTVPTLPTETTVPGCRDKLTWCGLVKLRGLCNQKFYANGCCLTCGSQLHQPR